jgi:cytosine/adenosine deaminase-related metal-dependent hydrolase
VRAAPNTAGGSTTSDRGEDPPIRTVVRWHAEDGDEVEQALRQALEAVVERAQFLGFVLDQPDAYGLADAEQLRRRIEGDEASAVVLGRLLDGGGPPRIRQD